MSSPLLYIIIVIVIGAVATGIARLVVQLYGDATKKRAMAAGIAAELSVFFESAEKRDHAQKYQDYYDKWLDTVDTLKNIGDFPRLRFASIEDAEKFSVYDSLVRYIGNLGPELTSEVVKIYSTIISIRRNLYRIEKDTTSGERIIKSDHEDLGQILKDWDTTLKNWEKLSDSLRKKSGSIA